MPEVISKVKGGYQVKGPHGIHAKHTTKEKAEAQARLLRGVEHGWRPTHGKDTDKNGNWTSSYHHK